MSEKELLSEEEYAIATLGKSGFVPKYKEYIQIEKRKELRQAFDILFKYNQIPFYPCEEENFTEIINGFSGKQLNWINEIIEKFHERIKEWDYRPKKK